MKLNTCGTCKYFCKEIEGFSCLACKSYSLYEQDDEVIQEVKKKAYLSYMVREYPDLSVDELLKKMQNVDCSKIYLVKSITDLGRELLAEDAARMTGTEFLQHIGHLINFSAYGETVLQCTGGSIADMSCSHNGLDFYLDTSE